MRNFYEITILFINKTTKAVMVLFFFVTFIISYFHIYKKIYYSKEKNTIIQCQKVADNQDYTRKNSSIPL